MPYKILCYKHTNETIPFEEWSDKLQNTQKAKLHMKLDILSRVGEELRPTTLTDTNVPGIFKIRVQGNVKLRPLLCRNLDGSGYVFLVGAKEVGGELKPKGILDKAVNYKDKLLQNFELRSTTYERYK